MDLRRARVAASIGVAAGLAVMGSRLAMNSSGKLRKAITIRRPCQEVYRFWRDYLVREWHTELTAERPNEFIAWRDGTVLFAPAPGKRGTEVRVQVDYSASASRLDADLRNVKQILEAGEVIRSAATKERNDLLQRAGVLS